MRKCFLKMKESEIKSKLEDRSIHWSRRAILVAAFHSLKTRQYGEAVPGRPSIGTRKGWSVRDTAEELKLSIGYVSDSIRLAIYFQENSNDIKSTRTGTLKKLRQENEYHRRS